MFTMRPGNSSFFLFRATPRSSPFALCPSALLKAQLCIKLIRHQDLRPDGHLHPVSLPGEKGAHRLRSCCSLFEGDGCQGGGFVCVRHLRTSIGHQSTNNRPFAPAPGSGMERIGIMKKTIASLCVCFLVSCTAYASSSREDLQARIESAK